MKSKHRFITVLLLFMTLLTCFPEFSLGTSTCLPNAVGNERLITIEILKATLPDHPIIAGFDIDDTVLFSSPGFNYGLSNTDGKDGKNIYGKEPLKNPEFWEAMNLEYDKFSIPKESGKTLLKLHKIRGDTIVFITARTCTQEQTEALDKRLNKVFELTRSTVVCTNKDMANDPETATKTGSIEKNGIDIYYGDSDSDIEDARAAKKKMVRPIRVERSPLSTYKSGYTLGAYCEEILVDSEN